MTSHFRAEIAGLRAVAVISVVLFHLKVGGFEGGFVGVDIFFVISGYLITRNILRDLQAERFSFGQFYIRRTRRIYPALIFTVVATYVCGALWCSPEMFLDLAKESTHALLSISNIQYWRESHRYFAPSSDELALLHCWSLSAEEQFYLFWPVLVVLALKLGRTFEVITIAALVSFFLSILTVRADPLVVFFLMPFRIFEFAIGALVLLLEARFRYRKNIAGGLSAAGLLLIATSVFLIKSDMPHLEWATLLPCLGAAATIWAGNETRTSKILTNPAMVAVGAISYSLYLCHWPIIFFGRFLFGDQANTWVGLLAMAALMGVVATGMYLFVERRFIQSSDAKPTSFLRYSAGFWSLVLTLVAITHATFLSKGFPWRLPKPQAELAHLQDFPSGRDMVPIEGPLGFQLMGDSLATQYVAGLASLAKQLNTPFEVLGGAGCPILYGVKLKALRREECTLARDNDTLDSVDQFKGAVVIIPDRLGGLAPAAVEDGVGGGNFRGGGGVLAAHHADQDIERGPGVAARQRADFGEGFGHLTFSRRGIGCIRPEIFARRRVDMIHDEIVGPCRRPKRDGRKVRVFAIALRAADESNDLCAHDNPSHTAIATRQAKASEIRCAVMLALLV
jgi:peptidoglycan/LPS O-acetylase OafA/YrhL